MGCKKMYYMYIVPVLVNLKREINVSLTMITWKKWCTVYIGNMEQTIDIRGPEH